MHLKTKRELRKEILKLRDALTLEERERKSKEITKRVIAHKAFKQADIILLFSSFKSEVDTTEIFETAQRFSKDIYYPKVIGDEMEFYRVEHEIDLKEGYRGICEPKADNDRKFMAQPDEKICVIMPGVAFDEVGNRIGYGGGYYDKFLRRMRRSLSTENISKVAIGFDCQLVEPGAIEVEEHDIRLDVLVTENKIIEFLEPANTK